jgi:hypothetical protein
LSSVYSLKTQNKWPNHSPPQMPTLIARPNAIEMSALAPQWLPGTACAPGSQLTDKFEPDTVDTTISSIPLVVG